MLEKLRVKNHVRAACRGRDSAVGAHTPAVTIACTSLLLGQALMMSSPAQAAGSPEAPAAEAAPAEIILAAAARAEAAPTEFASADAAAAASDAAPAAADSAPAEAGPEAPASSDAPADASSSELAEVVVTGSHIARSDYNSPQPVTAISAETLQRA